MTFKPGSNRTVCFTPYDRNPDRVSDATKYILCQSCSRFGHDKGNPLGIEWLVVARCRVLYLQKKQVL